MERTDNHSLAPQRKKTVAITNNLEILRLCKKHDVPLILSSDAHISFFFPDSGLQPYHAACGGSRISR